MPKLPLLTVVLNTFQETYIYIKIYLHFLLFPSKRALAVKIPPCRRPVYFV